MFDAYYLQIALKVLALCLVVTGIHVYFGTHIISRKVIFADLAMAQIAALGSTYALVLGYDSMNPANKVPTYLFSLGFTLLGAAVFAFTRIRHERVPQEAIIGITYVSASALVILMLAKSPTAGEHIKHMLVGNVILVDWPTIIKTALIYLPIGAFHWIFRKKFFMITSDYDGAVMAGLKVYLWDFFFYATFGVMITTSVSIAGVLLVFTYLVVPAAMSFLFFESMASRVLTGLLFGTVLSIIGILSSLGGDLPSGPAIVSVFAGGLMLAGIVHFMLHAPSKRLAAVKVFASVLIVVLAFYGTSFLQKKEDAHKHATGMDSILEALHGDNEAQQIEAIDKLAQQADPKMLPHMIQVLEAAPSGGVIERIAQALPSFKDGSATAALTRIAEREKDPFLRIELARALLRSGSQDGVRILSSIINNADAPMAKQEAKKVLKDLTGKDF